MLNTLLRIGTAGWALPSALRDQFPLGTNLLQRYSQRFNCVEINTCFYKSHQTKTYARWAAETPPDFQFVVKMPKQITHDKKLVGAEDLLDRFIEEITGLQSKLGVLLIQLPPSLRFKATIARIFFGYLRDKFHGKVVLEPRHLSWAQQDAVELMRTFHSVYALADPVKVPVEARANSEQSFTYYRLHGSPHIYSSSYSAAFLEQLAKQLNRTSWVIFDNTQFGAATQNALDLRQMV